MNISRLTQTPAPFQPAPARPVSSQPTLPTPPAADPTEAGVEGIHEQTHHHSARVAHAASHLQTRLQNAIAHGHLSDEQVTALKAATDQFTELMNRIAEAGFSGSPQRQVHFALGQLHNQIQAILHPQGDSQPGQGALPTGDESGTPPSFDALA